MYVDTCRITKVVRQGRAGWVCLFLRPIIPNHLLYYPLLLASTSSFSTCPTSMLMSTSVSPLAFLDPSPHYFTPPGPEGLMHNSIMDWFLLSKKNFGHLVSEVGTTSPHAGAQPVGSTCTKLSTFFWIYLITNSLACPVQSGQSVGKPAPEVKKWQVVVCCAQVTYCKDEKGNMKDLGI